jgi:hypothetical protein
MMEAVFSSELLVPIYQTTRHHIPEDCNPDIHCCKNLKSHISSIFDFEMKINKNIRKSNLEVQKSKYQSFPLNTEDHTNSVWLKCGVNNTYNKSPT